VGLLILVGVIVNNGIVLVDYTNLLRRRGESLEDACVHAARNRLRPILMSVLTTVLGLVPMAFFPGDGAEMTGPIGKTVLGGLSWGTVMTLFLVPCIYYIFNTGNEKKIRSRTVIARKNFELEFAREKAAFSTDSITTPQSNAVESVRYNVVETKPLHIVETPPRKPDNGEYEGESL
jgi:HAE1 family hydrophobic/amphiphilic exporter-1